MLWLGLLLGLLPSLRAVLAVAGVANLPVGPGGEVDSGPQPGQCIEQPCNVLCSLLAGFGVAHSNQYPGGRVPKPPLRHTGLTACSV